VPPCLNAVISTPMVPETCVAYVLKRGIHAAKRMIRASLVRGFHVPLPFLGPPLISKLPSSAVFRGMRHQRSVGASPTTANNSDR
jgi:hypothetical protein